VIESVSKKFFTEQSALKMQSKNRSRRQAILSKTGRRAVRKHFFVLENVKEYPGHLCFNLYMNQYF